MHLITLPCHHPCCSAHCPWCREDCLPQAREDCVDHCLQREAGIMGCNHTLFTPNVVPGLNDSAGWNCMPAIPNPIQCDGMSGSFTHDILSEMLFNLMADPALEWFVKADIHCLQFQGAVCRNTFQFSVSSSNGIPNLTCKVRWARIDQQCLRALNS